MKTSVTFYSSSSSLSLFSCQVLEKELQWGWEAIQLLTLDTMLNGWVLPPRESGLGSLKSWWAGQR